MNKPKSPSLIIIVFFSLVVVPGQAQTKRVMREGVQVSRSLSGHVNVGLEKSPAKGITVEIRSTDWKMVLASTVTDDNDYFSFGERPGKLF